MQNLTTMLTNGFIAIEEQFSFKKQLSILQQNQESNNLLAIDSPSELQELKNLKAQLQLKELELQELKQKLQNVDEKNLQELEQRQKNLIELLQQWKKELLKLLQQVNQSNQELKQKIFSEKKIKREELLKQNQTNIKIFENLNVISQDIFILIEEPSYLKEQPGKQLLIEDKSSFQELQDQVDIIRKKTESQQLKFTKIGQDLLSDKLALENLQIELLFQTSPLVAEQQLVELLKEQKQKEELLISFMDNLNNLLKQIQNLKKQLIQ